MNFVLFIYIVYHPFNGPVHPNYHQFIVILQQAKFAFCVTHCTKYHVTVNIYKFTTVTDQLYCKWGGGGAILCVVLTSATGEDPAPSTTPIHNNQILPNSMGEIAN